MILNEKTDMKNEMGSYGCLEDNSFDAILKATARGNVFSWKAREVFDWFSYEVIIESSCFLTPDKCSKIQLKIEISDEDVLSQMIEQEKGCLFSLSYAKAKRIINAISSANGAYTCDRLASVVLRYRFQRPTVFPKEINKYLKDIFKTKNKWEEIDTEIIKRDFNRPCDRAFRYATDLDCEFYYIISIAEGFPTVTNKYEFLFANSDIYVCEEIIWKDSETPELRNKNRSLRKYSRESVCDYRKENLRNKQDNIIWIIYSLDNPIPYLDKSNIRQDDLSKSDYYAYSNRFLYYLKGSKEKQRQQVHRALVEYKIKEKINRLDHTHVSVKIDVYDLQKGKALMLGEPLQERDGYIYNYKWCVLGMIEQYPNNIDVFIQHGFIHIDSIRAEEIITVYDPISYLCEDGSVEDRDTRNELIITLELTENEL